MSTITERVERGAALLDEKQPGWWRQVELDLLDIESRCGCVLGQLGYQAFPCTTPAEMYSNGLFLVRLDGDYQARQYGFDAETDVDALCDERGDVDAGRILNDEFEALTAAWRDLIERRRDAASVTA